MTRTLKAILLIVLVPLLGIAILSYICFASQPEVYDVPLKLEDSHTTYLAERKLYEISGQFGCLLGQLVVPGLADDATPTEDGNSPFYNSLLDNSNFTTINSLNESKAEASILNGVSEATIFFSLNLPAKEKYAFALPSEFCEFIVFVNGEPVVKSRSFYEKKFAYPRLILVELPSNNTGLYEVVVNVRTPKDYVNLGFKYPTIGTYEEMNHFYKTMRDATLFGCSFIMFTIVFFFLQIIFKKPDMRIISFILFSFMTMISTAYLDERVILMLIPGLPYQIGIFNETIYPPLYQLTLLLFTKQLYPESFPKKYMKFYLILLVLPFVNAITLRSIPLVNTGSILVEMLLYLLCLHVFAHEFVKRSSHALVYGISMLSMLTLSAVRNVTNTFVMPSHFPLALGYFILAIMMVSIVASEYVNQNKEEEFVTKELSRQLETMQASENAFLNAQMKPHFLYNTLNTIADCCVTDSPKAKKLINSLSDYLKLILNLDSMDETVPLRRELELAASYTAIEKERFPSINFYTDFPVRFPALMMPPLTIQPLIENAIKHGVRKSEKPGVVTLRIVDNKEYVEFFVSDNGVGMDEETINKLFRMPSANTSIGIYNIDTRLKNLYGEGLLVESTIGLGTCISFKIPKDS